MIPDYQNEKYGIKLYRGNCIDVVPQLPAGSIDAVITDPPYGTTACKWDSIIPFDIMWTFLNHVRKRNAAIVLTGSEPFSSFLRVSNIKEYKYDLYWQKTRVGHFAQAPYRPLTIFENVSVFSTGGVSENAKEKCPYNPQGVKSCEKICKQKGTSEHRKSSANKGKPYKQRGTGYPTQHILFESVHKPEHPTQKPVALMEYLIRTYTNPGETVLDFTMGSGTTGVACINTGRKFIGIEMDTVDHGDKYFKIAINRIENAIEKIEQDLFATVIEPKETLV